ncbi:N-acetyltransferase [Levilactobacillus tangyuanensis]|uniref:N-acetyltransferase n=1 Tax=Levilactobacillus tangyuanensis TaxID=2486021 RepID=A0ABW1TMU9_9LACO|nr:N-acetyltransferase [Levilactobacillus tangyuanensis]
MASFEGYHPLLTRRYRFDWLTRFNLKNVADLTQQELSPTADWINATMRDTMDRRKLVWGIEDRATHKLVAWGGFPTLDLGEQTGQVYVLGRPLPTADQQEILERLVAFGRDELQLSTLTLQTAKHLDPEALEAAGFNSKSPQHWEWHRYR